MAKLIIHHTGEEFELPDGSPIADSCEAAGLPISCGVGICGTCILKVVEGMNNLSKPTKEEIEFLGEDGVKQERMACQCTLLSGTVRVKF